MATALLKALRVVCFCLTLPAAKTFQVTFQEQSDKTLQVTSEVLDKLGISPSSGSQRGTAADLQAPPRFRWGFFRGAGESVKASPTQQPLAKTPPSAPQPQIKHNDIFKAAEVGDVEAVRALIASDRYKDGKSILDKRDESQYKNTPFLVAAEKGHVDVMSVIHEKKPDVLQQTDENRDNALHHAASNGRLAAVDQLLEWDPKLIDARDKGGKTSFMLAAYYGHVKVMEALFAKGGEKLLTQTDNSGTTPFILAASSGHVGALKALYAKGGKELLTEKDNRGWTALHWAAYSNQSAAVSQLLEWGGGALLNIKTTKWSGEKTPWELAKEKPNIRKIMKEYKNKK